MFNIYGIVILNIKYLGNIFTAGYKKKVIQFSSYKPISAARFRNNYHTNKIHQVVTLQSAHI